MALLDWALSTLEQHGLELAGDPGEPRRRQWSLLIRIPTTHRTARGVEPAQRPTATWAKANAPAFAHEGPLLQLISQLQPGTVLKPIAIERDRGWLLSPDGGATLDDDTRWIEVVESYAQLQQTLSTHVDDLRAAGVPYLPPDRLGRIARHYGRGDLEPAIARYAAILAESRRLTLEHNDLHPGNVFGADGLLFDWGDSVITHPFLSVRGHAAPWWPAYLEQWGPIPEDELDAARRLAPLVALHPWMTIDTASEPAFTGYVRGLLGQLQQSLRD